MHILYVDNTIFRKDTILAQQKNIDFLYDILIRLFMKCSKYRIILIDLLDN